MEISKVKLPHVPNNPFFFSYILSFLPLHQVVYYIFFLLFFFLEFHACIEDKMDHHFDLEEHLDTIFQTSRDKREVD